MPAKGRSPHLGRAATAARLSLLLGALALAAQAAPQPVAGAAPGLGETAQLVMGELAAQGYATPQQALRRLVQASAPAADAPLESRWRYLAALSGLALGAGDEAHLRLSLEALQRMVEREACTPCATLQALRRLQRAESEDPDTLRQRLDALQALPVPDDPWLRFERHRALATAHMAFNDPQSAITEALQAAEIGAVLERPADRVMALELLGNISATRRDMPKAVEHARQSAALAREIGFGYGLVRSLFNLSYALATQKENVERKALLLELLTLTEGQPELGFERQNVLINLAALSNDIGEYRNALAYAHRAEQGADRELDPNGYAFALVNRGVALVHQGQFDEGLELVQRAVEIGKRTGVKRELADLIEQQVNALEAAGRAPAALQALRRWVSLNGELTTSAREQAIARMQERLDAQQRQREIERLRLDKAKGEAELQLRAWRERAWAGAALLVALLAAIGWRALRRSRRQNQRLRGDVARLADESLHDALTSAWNRRHGENLLQQLEADSAALAQEQRLGVALLLLDIDHFKRVNDGHGHAAGDAVLVELTHRVQTMLRQGDALVRWGGEEFLLVLPGVGEPGLRRFAQRLLAAIGEAPVALPSLSSALPVRASIGALVWAAGRGRSWARHLALADAALYRAKAEGRNRLLLTGSEEVFDDAELAQLDALLAAGRLRLETIKGVPLADD